MVKYADDVMAQAAQRQVEIKKKKKELEDMLVQNEKVLKEGMEERHTLCQQFGDNVVSIVKVAESLTVDSAKLKADGLYDKYSKKKAGYSQVRVTPESEMSKKPVKNDGAPF